jgi:tRNA 2-thiouridine synthesizing protein A
MAAIMPFPGRDPDGRSCVHRMERVLDVRGLNCPLPLIKARTALAGMAAGDVLVVLATDPEAPIDLAALAADQGHALATRQEQGHWRIAVTKGA